jgi:hypothetical protein
MKEGDRYTKDGMRHIKIPYWLVIKKYWTRLVPVSIIWFLYDFSAYSFGIYSSTILDRVIPDTVILEFGCADSRRCISHLDGISLFCYSISPELLWEHWPRITWVQNSLLLWVYSFKQSLVSSCRDFMRNSLLKLERSSLCVCCSLKIYSNQRWSIFVIWRIWTRR